MDSDEEAALTAITITTFTENIKREKGRTERNELILGFNSKLPINSILSYFVCCVSYADFAIFTRPNLNFFSTSMFPEIS